MTDFYPLLSRAIGALDRKTPEARRAVYDRARQMLVRQLRSMNPRVSEADIRTEQSALEDAIKRIERETAQNNYITDRSASKPQDAETAKAKCVYCGTELNPGARVCHACARGQPDPRRAERLFYAFCAIVLLSVIGGFVGYQIYQAHEFEKAVRVVELGAMVAQTPMTHDQARKYVQDIMTSANVSASDAVKII